MEYVLVCFMVHKLLKEDEKLVIVGDDEALGSWDVSRGLPLANLPLGSSQWVGVARFPAKKQSYKAVVMSADGACWETVQNRQVSLASPGQALVKFQFNQPMEHLEITNEPEPALATYPDGRAQVVLPYWRQSLTSKYTFVQETNGSTERHSCVYLQKEGTAVVNLRIPEDSRLVGHFEVQCGSDFKKSDRREVVLPKDGATCKILWPFSSLEDHSVSEFIKSPNTSEPSEKVLDDISSHFSEDQQEAPPIQTVSPVTHQEKEREKKIKGLRRLLHGVRRLLKRIKQR